MRFCIDIDKPESMTLDWEHSVNKPDAVKPNQEYKLRCTSKHSKPPATHRYFKDGVELSSNMIRYTYQNDTDSSKLSSPDYNYSGVTVNFLCIFTSNVL